MPGLDLISFPARGRYREERWGRAIATEAEQTWLHQQPDRGEAQLSLWAAKEAAYKASCHGCTGPLTFRPRHWEITFVGASFTWRTAQGTGRGSGRWWRQADHGIALAELTGANWDTLCHRYQYAPGLLPAQRSLAVRTLLLALIAEVYPQLPPGSWYVAQNPNGAPLVSMDHGTLLLPAALSHDGPWLGAALKLDPYDPSP
jgi:hypothetical protein